MSKEKERLEDIKKKLEEWNISYTDCRPCGKTRLDDVLMEDAEPDIIWLFSQLAEKDREIERWKARAEELEDVDENNNAWRRKVAVLEAKLEECRKIRNSLIHRAALEDEG